MKRTSQSRTAARKLTLHTETVKKLSTLTDHELRRVVGGNSLASDCLEVLCQEQAG